MSRLVNYLLIELTCDLNNPMLEFRGIESVIWGSSPTEVGNM